MPVAEQSDTSSTCASSSAGCQSTTQRRATRAADSSARLYGQPLLMIPLQRESHLEKNQGEPKAGLAERSPQTGQRLPKSFLQCRGTLDGRQVLTQISLRIEPARVKGTASFGTHEGSYSGSILKISISGKCDWQDFCHRRTGIPKMPISRPESRLFKFSPDITIVFGN